jgi:hypothetical protein
MRIYFKILYLHILPSLVPHKITAMYVMYAQILLPVGRTIQVKCFLHRCYDCRIFRFRRFSPNL